MKRRLRRLALLLAWVILSLPGFAGAEQQSLRVGSRIDFPPYADVDAQGHSIGFAVELFAAVAAVMDIPVSFQPDRRDILWRKLKVGEIDALPLVEQTAEHQSQVELTQPHTIGYDTFFTRKKHEPIQSIEQARAFNIIIVRSDAGHESLASRGFNQQLVFVDSLADGFRLLASGQHDALLAPVLQGNRLVRNLGLEGIVEPGPLLKEYRREFCFAVRKGDTELRDRLNRGLTIVKANAEYDHLYRKWLGLYETPTFPVKYVVWSAVAAVSLFALLGLWTWTLRRQVALRTIELTQAYTTVQAERQRLHDVLQALPVYVILLSQDCQVTFANRFFEQRYGKAQGQHCYKYLFGCSEVCEDFKALKTGAPIDREWTTPDGRDYEIHDFPFTNADGSLMIMQVGIDVTETKRAKRALCETNASLEQHVAERTAELEAARLEAEQTRDLLHEADHHKDEFLAMLAHELRNPLAPISNAAQIMKRSSLDETQLAWCRDVINRQVEHLVRLVDDLLDVSRISRGKIELKKESLEVATIVQWAVETSQPLIDAHRHEFTVQLPPEPVYVEGDLVRLSQVVSNLLNNAAKYTDEGGCIELAVEQTDDELFIRVRDNGRGIDPAALPNLFQLFYQVNRTIDRSEGGLGIGLSLVKSLVTMHGGDVWADSEGRGQGSEFVVRLPCLPQAPTVPIFFSRLEAG